MALGQLPVIIVLWYLEQRDPMDILKHRPHIISFGKGHQCIFLYILLICSHPILKLERDGNIEHVNHANEIEKESKYSLCINLLDFMSQEYKYKVFTRGHCLIYPHSRNQSE